MPLKLYFNEFNDDEDGLRYYVSSTPLYPNNLPAPVDETGPSDTLTAEPGRGPNAVSHIVSGDATGSYFIKVSAFKGDVEVASQEWHYDPEGGGGEPTGDIIGVVLIDSSVQGGNLVHIDANGNTISNPGTAWFDNAYPWSGMVDETIDGQHLVKVPRFYYRRGPVVGGEHDGRDAWWISPAPAAGFTLHPAFDGGLGPRDQFWYGKYQGFIDGEGKLASVPGVVPTRSRSITQFFADAEARNVGGVTGFRIHHGAMVSAIQWLALIEAATFDSQAYYGTGLNSSSSPQAVDSTANQEASYRGIIGAWGNIWQWMDGIRHTSGTIERRGYEVGSLATGWSSTGQTRPSTGVHSPMSVRDAASVEDIFIADALQSSDVNALIPDYYSFANTGTRYAYMGGGSTGGRPGLWSLSVNTATHTYTDLGSRLARV